MSISASGPLAVIFDMDGVLVNSYRAHFASWQRFYRELGVDYTESQFAADFGRTGRDILRRTLGKQVTDDEARALDARKEGYYREILRDDFPAMDGATELIEAFAANGFRLAIGSSGPAENIELIREILPGARHISATVNGNDVTRGKPDPQVFLLAAQRLGVPPHYCAVIEDAVHGIEAAKSARMVTIALTGTDLVVDSLRALTPTKVRRLIERQNS